MQRLDGKSKDISKIAADITQNMSLRQGIERKKVIQHIRSLYKTDLSASRHWQELVQQLTHDQSVPLASPAFTWIILFCFVSFYFSSRQVTLFLVIMHYRVESIN